MNKAKLAQDILQNPVWKETFETLQQYYYQEFRAAVGDSKTRERIAIANDILDDFESFLNQAVVEGVNLRAVGDNNE